jgi:enoyl-CoA hydratase
VNYRNILFDKANGIGTVTVNRPEALNALNSEAFAELLELFQEIESDPEVRVVILTGIGEKAFIAGTDLVAMQSLTSAEAQIFARNARKTYDRLYTLSKPTIAAVNGFALGGGCEMAMCCDMRLASENARFGQPEINFAIIPGSGGTQRLPKLVGMAKAKELIFTGAYIDANTALNIGLVNKVVPLANLLNEAKDLAAKMLSKSSIALAMAKAAINGGANTNLIAGLDLEEQCFALCFATEDQKEGMKAFVEKRKAQFKNK